MSEDTQAVNQTAEAPATTESAPVEKELEVIREGEPIEPVLYEQTETESEEVQESPKDVDSEEQPAEETPDDKPLGEKGMRRNQQLANQVRELKQYIKQLESQTQPEKYDVKDAVENKGLTPEQARIEALEHNQRISEERIANEQANRELQDLNVTVRTEAENVLKDFPDLTANDADTELLMNAWQEVASVEYMKDENGDIVNAPDGAPVLKQANFSLYDFANLIDHFASSRQKVGEVNGQKAAEKNLAAVEAKPSVKPKASNKDDSKLSADAYAKKYGLSTVR